MTHTYALHSNMLLFPIPTRETPKAQTGQSRPTTRASSWPSLGLAGGLLGSDGFDSWRHELDELYNSLARKLCQPVGHAHFTTHPLVTMAAFSGFFFFFPHCKGDYPTTAIT